jgi:cholesterol transport system auxiliary component
MRVATTTRRHVTPGLALFCALLTLLVAACSLRPAPRAPVGHYDLGPPAFATQGAPSQTPLRAVFVVPEPSGPIWLDGGDMTYRLAYDEPWRIRRYANSQWAVSPLSLLGERLRASLALRAERGGAVPDLGLSADYSTRVIVDELCQVFDSTSSSRGVVRFRVVLTRNRGNVFLAQRSFEAEAPAPSADARGGVEALRLAVDASVAQAAAWLAETAAKDIE